VSTGIGGSTSRRSASARSRSSPGRGTSRSLSWVTWFAGIKDLLAICIALLAIVISLITLIMQRSETKRAAYREIYTELMSEDLHRGRWAIFAIKTPDEIPSNEEDRRLIYRTLGVFDNLAMFVRHHVVPRKWVLDVWHHPLRDMRPAADLIRARHTAETGQIPWPELWSLFSEAATYRSSLPCCQNDQPPKR
jgi:hypothetical protein